MTVFLAVAGVFLTINIVFLIMSLLHTLLKNDDKGVPRVSLAPSALSCADTERRHSNNPHVTNDSSRKQRSMMISWRQIPRIFFPQTLKYCSDNNRSNIYTDRL
ncbi:uncharacterized protein LOC106142696 isoform X2 [Amyelois transitella]|uniref:uncharacterized protein LOC106142696 isoform X2 n=1 Tax=Amyelois transitella TaxID=680683 RepID=UPI00067DA96F|nr:uncharacterized protein LOC106142696 isoform X2 [Amyelois transitella]